MRWTPGGDSEDLEDRRAEGGGGGGFNIGGFGAPHIGIGGLLLLGVLSFVFKIDLISPFLGTSGGSAPTHAVSNPVNDQAEEPQVKFVSFVLDDTQKTWEQIMAQSGKQYRHAKLVLFRDETNSGCGDAQAASGPFYCPDDEKVYLDLAFFDELSQRFGAPGDFARAYVIAHELGHHVQKLLGIEGQVQRLQSAHPDQQNPLSVRLELQADCFAGVWGYSAAQRGIVEKGDAEAALMAASAVGDDHLQKLAGRRVSPETFTHGSSEQRMMWFNQGFTSGKLGACNTFGGQ